ncbi:MAG: hypothetical protein QM784_36735 [Polyangiaceae bacterium]
MEPATAVVAKAVDAALAAPQAPAPVVDSGPAPNPEVEVAANAAMHFKLSDGGVVDDLSPATLAEADSSAERHARVGSGGSACSRKQP